MSPRGRAGVVLAASLLALGLLAGCGDRRAEPAADPGASPTATETVQPSVGSSSSAPPTQSAGPRGPACARAWRGGATLPAHYRGCRAGQQWIRADGIECSFGKRLIT